MFRMQLKKLRPVYAHPERCAHFVGRMEVAQAIFDAGGLFQIEVGSLAGIYGPPAKKFARQLIDEGLVALAATDAHHARSTAEILGTGMKTLEKELGPSRVALLTEENPARVLRGEPLSLF
jgi:protein-tyrosine phosphatase